MDRKSLERANGDGKRRARRVFGLKSAGFLAAVFFALGVYLPFFPVWLEAQGLSDGQIGVAVALPLLVRAVLSGTLAAAADRLGELRVAAALYAGIATFVFFALNFAGGAAALLLISSAALIFWNALIPLGDAVALTGVRRHGNDYGRIRLWGSVAFIVGNFAAGQIISSVSVDAVYGLQLAAFAFGIVAALSLPLVGRAAKLAKGGGMIGFPRDRRLVLTIAAASLVTGSHGAYYAFGSLYWRSLGFSDLVIAALWSLGVVIEIALFWFARHFVGWGARRFLIAGATGALLRWSLFAFATDVTWAFVLQVLHGLTFAATHLGAMMALAAVAEAGHTARLQAAYQLSAGLVIGSGTLAAGVLYGIAPSLPFLLMAAFGACALAIAWRLPRGLKA
ncbi:MFS transporter [Afifella sp. YEN Y35]|uniref:MFS transporter n=1 Tax=Afifella sp. YEN Y35 TaxID=3388337 RepID=UPI0039E0F8AB